MITIALIDDNRLVREGLTELLARAPDVKVVGGASSADPNLLSRWNPQVVLLDLGLRNGDSLRLAQRIRQKLPEARIIVMDLLPIQEEVMELVHAGVSGFIMKDSSLDVFFDTIRSVAAGKDVLPPQMTSSLFAQIAKVAVENGRGPASSAVRMTAREKQVIGLISEGLGNKKIAASLHISIHTVKSHIRNVMEKLALHTRLQIAAYAHRQDDQSD